MPRATPNCFREPFSRLTPYCLHPWFTTWRSLTRVSRTTTASRGTRTFPTIPLAASYMRRTLELRQGSRHSITCFTANISSLGPTPEQSTVPSCTSTREPNGSHAAVSIKKPQPCTPTSFSPNYGHSCMAGTYRWWCIAGDSRKLGSIGWSGAARSPITTFLRLSLVMFLLDNPQTPGGALQFSGSYPQTGFVTFVTEYLRGTHYPPPT